MYVNKLIRCLFGLMRGAYNLLRVPKILMPQDTEYTCRMIQIEILRLNVNLLIFSD